MTIRLSDALTLDAVRLRSSWPSFEATVRALVETLADAGRLPQANIDEAVRILCEREEISSTAIVEISVSIPHARFPAVDGIVAALAVAPEGVYQHGHGLPISIVVLVLTSPKLTTEHLGFLASLSMLLQSERLRDSIEKAVSPQQVMALIAEHEHGMPRIRA